MSLLQKHPSALGIIAAFVFFAFILSSSSSYSSITLSFAIFSACLSLNPIWGLIIVHYVPDKNLCYKRSS